MNNKQFPTYLFFAALSVFLLSCDEEKTNPLDANINQPRISWFATTPDIVDTDSMLVGGESLPNDLLTINIHISSKVTDPDGTPDIKKVKFRILKPSSTSVVASGEMSAGSPPSSVTVLPNEVYYSAHSSFKIRRVNVGDYIIEIQAEDHSNLASNTSLHRLSIRRSSRAPVLSNLVAPDTITLPPSPYSVLFSISVAAADSDGLSDIYSVYFRNLDSPSDPNKKNFLYDDGLGDDSLAGDGIFTATFRLDWNNPPQTYRFEFEAEDQLEYTGNRILHYMVVRQP